MNIGAVRVELAEVLATVPGLKAHHYTTKRIVPPAAIVSLPDMIDFHGSFQRGQSDMVLFVHVLVGLASERSAEAALSAYASPETSGHSVPAAIEGHSWVSCDEVTVLTADFTVLTVAGTDYLAASFTCNITGSGS